MLNIPVFREPERAVDEHRTSPIKPLKSSTWLRYLRRLGRNSGLELKLAIDLGLCLANTLWSWLGMRFVIL